MSAYQINKFSFEIVYKYLESLYQYTKLRLREIDWCIQNLNHIGEEGDEVKVKTELSHKTWIIESIDYGTAP